MTRSLFIVAVLASFGFGGCKRDAAPAPASPAAQIEREETARAQRAEEQPKCGHPIHVYDGSITVDAADYQHTVPRGGDYVDAPISDLDRVISTLPEIRFTLDYPFSKAFKGTLTGKITLRRVIDAIRAGFRQMYAGANEKDIPGMMNRDVTGAYGHAFHVIGDLVIESIDLCDGGWLDISIGS